MAWTKRELLGWVPQNLPGYTCDPKEIAKMFRAQGEQMPPSTEEKRVRCVVSCRTADGTPTFFPVTVMVTDAQYANGDHYESARGAASEANYEDTGLVHDEYDGPQWLFERLFP